jgi:predicted O-methyltransferase YrrM
MSDSTGVWTQGHVDYLAARTRGDDAFLRELKTAALSAGIPSIWIAPEQASFLQILLRIARAKDVIEVGTLAGYSAIWMARALPAAGKVRTIELSAKHAAFAREWIARSDVRGKVDVIEGRGLDVLRTFADDSADAAFLDADKTGYGEYLEESLRILRPGGLVLVDNAFAFGQVLDERPKDREVPAVRAFNERMAREARLQSVIVPLGDGVWVGVKV